MSVTGFLAYLEVERRVSAHTLDAYRRDLAALTEWAQAHGITELADVQSEALRGFVAERLIARLDRTGQGVLCVSHAGAIEGLEARSFAQ